MPNKNDSIDAIEACWIGILAVLVVLVFAHFTAKAFDDAAKIEEAKTSAHLSQMDAETRRIVGGGK